MTTRDAVADIVRRCLEAGQRVEIDGLGVFQASPQGLEFLPQKQPNVFIAYADEDRALVRRLRDSLREEGCSPWVDKEKLLPGQNWPRAIERAIEMADAFVACFSPRSVVKPGQFQCELRYALECARKRPVAADEPFVIPVRLAECTVPRIISDHVQYVDLYPDWERGVRRVARTARKAAQNKPAVLLG